MKTIFIVISGLADLPSPETGGKTPLMLADTPSLDALAKCGCCGSVLPVPDDVPLTRETSVLGLLGYDFRRGIPDPDALARFGSIPSRVLSDPSLRYFILPRFSGHGVVISASDAVVGIGKMTLLKPCRVPGATGDLRSNLLGKSEAAIRAIADSEFVLLHVGAADVESRRGNLQGKIEAIERIDRDIVTPIADYVWNAQEQMNMVVTSDFISSWKIGCEVRGEVPAVVYFNDDAPYDTPAFDEATVADGPLNAPLPADLIKKLVTFGPALDIPEE